LVDQENREHRGHDDERAAGDERDAQHAAADGSQVLQDVPFPALGPASIPTKFNLLSERFTGQRASAIRPLAHRD
jgi:hypothetical protein